MSDPSWLAALDPGDLADFAGEMRAAIDSSVAARDAGPLETCLREWRATAEALSDPQRREVLAGPGDDDYVEVPRP
jgi:Family of unknown function (DUF6247)